MSTRSCLALAALAALATLPACDIYWGGDDDICREGDGAIYQVGLRNPETGVCESYGGGGGGGGCWEAQADSAGAPQAVPDWGECPSTCEQLSERACWAAERCRAVYEVPDCPARLAVRLVRHVHGLLEHRAVGPGLRARRLREPRRLRVLAPQRLRRALRPGHRLRAGAGDAVRSLCARAGAGLLRRRRVSERLGLHRRHRVPAAAGLRSVHRHGVPGGVLRPLRAAGERLRYRRLRPGYHCEERCFPCDTPNGEACRRSARRPACPTSTTARSTARPAPSASRPAPAARAPAIRTATPTCTWTCEPGGPLTCADVTCAPGETCELECTVGPNGGMGECRPVCVPVNGGTCAAIDCGPGFHCEEQCTMPPPCLPGGMCPGGTCGPVCLPNTDPGECSGDVLCDALPPTCPRHHARHPQRLLDGLLHPADRVRRAAAAGVRVDRRRDDLPRHRRLPPAVHRHLLARRQRPVAVHEHPVHALRDRRSGAAATDALTSRRE